jgi:hypothetical protein
VLVAASLASRAVADDEVSLHDLAARGDEARLARALTTGSPVDQRAASSHAAPRGRAGGAPLRRHGARRAPCESERARRPAADAAACGGGRYRTRRRALQDREDADREGRRPEGADTAEKQPVDYARTPEFKEALAP